MALAVGNVQALEVLQSRNLQLTVHGFMQNLTRGLVTRLLGQGE
eukprot:CAMPEP_0175979732 /NCGR_PEP_ID=MMETSP0108-20121206/46404_1 /TAXON_ID=195067 ORGANISM="Goniomonas pacifica, Strain CCMP1869" /NCGR_SAMPLE_ID=MMETSP0108 /ASSEMBLY_ACC=CAM_ASM_000204 /LENGTH=43 /DNA_ID= /DNA_START= /DNA_END= /DNA_ORIENTATION=